MRQITEAQVWLWGVCLHMCVCLCIHACLQHDLHASARVFSLLFYSNGDSLHTQDCGLPDSPVNSVLSQESWKKSHVLGAPGLSTNNSSLAGWGVGGMG